MQNLSGGVRFTWKDAKSSGYCTFQKQRMDEIEKKVKAEIKSGKKMIIKEVKTTAKKTTARKTTAKKETEVKIYIQHGCDTEVSEYIEKAKTLSEVKSPKTVNIYIKPEDNKVYYVVDDVNGDFDLF